ncbi:MAG: hypothetical protein JO273_15165 [Methylobacteriaceae bacterium]|nr:hypothetical protein [Methylobacteriaceae bacterium]
MSLRSIARAGCIAAAAVVISALGASMAQAKTCTVDLDDLARLRHDISQMLHDGVRVDRERAKALRSKYLEELKSGELALDPKDLKGVVSGRPKASKELIQELLAEVDKIVESCER